MRACIDIDDPSELWYNKIKPEPEVENEDIEGSDTYVTLPSSSKVSAK